MLRFTKEGGSGMWNPEGGLVVRTEVGGKWGGVGVEDEQVEEGKGTGSRSRGEEEIETRRCVWWWVPIEAGGNVR